MRRKRREPMPIEFNRLADYNGRVAQGIVHTKTYEVEMAELQTRFNEWQRKSLEAEGVRIVGAERDRGGAVGGFVEVAAKPTVPLSIEERDRS